MVEGVATLGSGREPPTRWPKHDAREVERHYKIWRHMRVAKARTMRHFHRLASMLALGLCPRVFNTAYGVRMYADWGDRSYAYCHFGAYSRYLADIISSIDCPFVFIDIGANQGLFSLVAAQQPTCKKVLAIEPVAATHDQLLRNIALNRAQERIIPLEFALSDYRGASTMRRLKVHSGVATLEPRFATGDPGTISQAVEVRRVEELYEYLPEGLPIFVKINVEGHEPTVLQEVLGSNFAGRIIGIFCSQDERRSDFQRLEVSMDRAGFACRQRYRRPKRTDVFAIPKSRDPMPSLGAANEYKLAGNR